MDKDIYTHDTMEHYSVKKNETLPFATTRVYREDVMPNEISQIKTNAT